MTSKYRARKARTTRTTRTARKTRRSARKFGKLFSLRRKSKPVSKPEKFYNIDFPHLGRAENMLKYEQSYGPGNLRDINKLYGYRLNDVSLTPLKGHFY